MKRPNAFGLLLPGLLLLSCLSALPANADRALIIGIDAYERDPRIGPLAGAVNDARAMRQFLIDAAEYHPEAIRLLTDAAATRAGILDAIESWLIEGSAPGERVFLHFSGHGAQLPDTDGTGLDQVLIAVDGHFDDDTRALRNVIRGSELDRLLDRVRDRPVTVVVDACHSGSLLARGLTRNADPRRLVRTPLDLQTLLPRPAQRSGSPIPPTFLPSRPNLTLWTASAAHQLAFEDVDREPRRGFFTDRFIQGIAQSAADRNGDGRVTHLEMHHWLTDLSAAYCRRINAEFGGLCATGLTPTLEVERSLQVEPVQSTLLDRPAPEPTLAEVVDETLLAPAPVQGDEAWAPDGSVGLAVLPRADARLGEVVRFEIRSDFDGHLLMLDINPAGRLVQLFPNRYSDRWGKGDRIERDRPITIPDATYGFEFRVGEPLGEGRLLALVTADPVDLSDLTDSHTGLVPIPIGAEQDYLLRIAESLRRTLAGDHQQRPVRWGIAEQPYRTYR